MFKSANKPDIQQNNKENIWKVLTVLAIPTMLEQLLSTLMQYVDTAMVGKLGPDATAAVSTTTTVGWLVNSLSAAVGVAMMTIIAVGMGAGDLKKVKRVSAQATILSLIVGGLITVATVGLSPFIPVWMGIDASVQPEASRYFMIITLPMVFRSFSLILGSTLRAVHDTGSPMRINLISNGINVVLNYLLIYVCGLHVTGAAIATAISTVISGVWTLIVCRRKSELRFLREDFKIDGSIMREGARIGLPVLATNFTSCLGYVVFSSMITGLGKVIFAAHSIAVTAEEIFYIPGYGLRTATQTLVGNSVGERNESKFKAVNRVSITITVTMMCLSGLVLYLVAHPLMTVFTNSEEVAVIGAGVLRMVAFSEPFFGLLIVLEGIYYGLGKTKLPFIVETGSMWIVRIFMTYLCVNFWGLGLHAVWYCMIADNVIKALIFIICSPATFRRAGAEIQKDAKVL